MAQRTIITVSSDLSGEAKAGTVVFGLDGQTYEIDLTDEEAADLREVLAPFMSVARPVDTDRKPTSRPSKRDGGTDPKAVRTWAKEQGIDVPARGRLPRSVVEQYQAAS